MPTLEGLEEASLEKIPDLTIAQMRFEISLSPTEAKELGIDQAEVNIYCFEILNFVRTFYSYFVLVPQLTDISQVKRSLMDKIKTGYMAKLYKEGSAELKRPLNNSVLEEMEQKNKEQLDKIDGMLKQ